MPVHLRATSAAIKRRPSLIRGRLQAFMTLVLAALVAGCAQAPPLHPLAGVGPANPSVRTRTVEYRSPLAPYESRRPVEPAPWREQNERVAPQPKQ